MHCALEPFRRLTQTIRDKYQPRFGGNAVELNAFIWNLGDFSVSQASLAGPSKNGCMVPVAAASSNSGSFFVVDNFDHSDQYHTSFLCRKNLKDFCYHHFLPEAPCK